MLEQLRALFEGKPVTITHTPPRLDDKEGECVKVEPDPGTAYQFRLVLHDRTHVGFNPEIVTDTTVECKINSFAGGKRKIEALPLSSDRRILLETMAEMIKATGLGGAVTPTLIGLLSRLESTYGNGVTVQGTCDALERLAAEALTLRTQLLRQVD